MLRKTASVVMLVLFVLSMLTLAFRIQPARSSPATITVPDEYPTIQAAINAAADGDTVFVRNETYYEHITISKPITLVGEDSSTTVIDGNGTGTVVYVAADYVSISNFTIRNAGLSYCLFCAYLNDIDIENNNILNATIGVCIGDSYAVNISNNFVSNTSLIGIDVGDTTEPGANLNSNRNITVSNNFVQWSTFDGINVDGETQYCSFTNNTVEDCASGIDLAPNANTRLVPSNNLVDGNVLSNNSLVNLFVIGAESRTQADYTNTFRGNTLTNSQYNNLIVWGYNLPSFMQDIDVSNTVNGKRIYYLVNATNFETDPSSYPNAGYMALVNCTNATAEDFDFSGNEDGLLLAGSSNCTLTNITLGDNRLYFAEGNVTAPSHWGGLTFFESDNNTVDDCAVCNNTYGVCLCYSDWNLFFHNSFVDNDRNVVSDYYYPFGNYSSGYLSTNFWDDGYPVGGNYWSDYNGTDLKSGPYQNETGSDGIGDSPYVIDANNTDMYPLMSPWSSDTGQLEVDYRSLLMGFNALQQNLTSLNSTVSGLQQQLTNLQQSISSLGFSLQGEINSLNQTNTSLGQSLTNLQTQIISVNSTLEGLINGLQEQNNRLNNQLGTILNVLYVLVALTIIAVISAIYFAVKRLKAKPKS